MTANDFYKSLFNCKTYKISLDAGCTCPTRDGTKAVGGCIFCSAAGSGDFTPSSRLSIPNQIQVAKDLLAPKLKHSANVKYLAYFQSFTNTYGDLGRLETLWRQALSCPDIVGLALGTRPDCLSDPCLEFLAGLADQNFVQLELGLQTTNEETASYIRRGYENKEYFEAVERIKKANPKIHIVTHLIFGLPGDETKDMMESLRQVIAAGSDGIKITCLYILEGTDLAKDFKAGKFKALEMEEYFGLLDQALKILPPAMVIHRLTGDPPKKILIEPKWTMNKKVVLNRMNKLLRDAGI